MNDSIDWSNFQLSIKNSPRLHWLCFNLHCDWIRKLAPLSRATTQMQTKTKRTLTPTFSRALGGLVAFNLSSY